MGGTSKRMEKFAHYMKDLLGYKIPTGLTINDITKVTNRYSMFKLGPILFANHGIGCPSLSILLNEIMKLLHYAGCHDLTFFVLELVEELVSIFKRRFIKGRFKKYQFFIKGVEPGTVIITEESVDGLLRPEYRQVNFKF